MQKSMYRNNKGYYIIANFPYKPWTPNLHVFMVLKTVTLYSLRHCTGLLQTFKEAKGRK